MSGGAQEQPPPAADSTLDLSAVRSDIVKRGYAYWRSRCAGRIPLRAMIDPADIPVLLPHIVIHGAKREPLDFVYRLIGGEVRRHMAEDRTGQWMSQIPGQRPPSRIWDNLAAIVANGQPVLNRTPYEGPLSDFVTMESLQLPLAADGVAVDMIIAFVDFLRKAERD
jgi:hypothetical protein